MGRMRCIRGIANAVSTRALVREHERLRNEVQRDTGVLFEQRRRASAVIETVEAFVNRLANTRKEFSKSIADCRGVTNRFNQTARDIEVESAHIARMGTVGAAGTGAGVALAALGPTATMAVATTFGTASTGTAISVLSGTAATNAALAWLGGGALAAGGGGMAAGSTFLALAGPVGWTIAGASVIGTAVVWRKAAKERKRIDSELQSLRTWQPTVRCLAKKTRTLTDEIIGQLSLLQRSAPPDYLKFDEASKERLGAAIDNINTLGRLLQTKVAL